MRQAGIEFQYDPSSEDDERREERAVRLPATRSRGGDGDVARGGGGGGGEGVGEETPAVEVEEGGRNIIAV